VLLTHKHWDHSGGNKDLREEFSDLIIVGSSRDFPENSCLNYFYCVNKRVQDEEIFQVGRLIFRVLMAPCHTMGSVMYLLEMDKIVQNVASAKECDYDQILELDAPSLFTGDTIFTGGAGKIHEQSTRAKR
jgi:glyoxylase-like metal-dependent hydrolase (beta-lactamase superfamily II)